MPTLLPMMQKGLESLCHGKTSVSPSKTFLASLRNNCLSLPLHTSTPTEFFGETLKPGVGSRKQLTLVDPPQAPLLVKPFCVPEVRY